MAVSKKPLHVSLQNDYSRIITDNLNTYTSLGVTKLYERIEMLWSIASKLRAYMEMEKADMVKSGNKSNCEVIDSFIGQVENKITEIESYKSREDIIKYVFLIKVPNVATIKEIMTHSNSLNRIRDDLEAVILKMGLSTFESSGVPETKE